MSEGLTRVGEDTVLKSPVDTFLLGFIEDPVVLVDTFGNLYSDGRREGRL